MWSSQKCNVTNHGFAHQSQAYTVRPLFKKFTQHCETYEPTNCCVKKDTQLV